MTKALLITFEGIDGSGKTTQIEYFMQKCKQENIPVVLFREPGGTPIGEKIREILLSKSNSGMFAITELLLYSASRHQLCRELIRPALESGKIVICDRFYDSTTAYQGYGRGIDLDFINLLNRIAADNLVPDLTFIFDIPITERFRRLGTRELDRLETEEQNFQEKVRQGFLKIAASEPNRVCLIDGTKTEDLVADEVWQNFNKLLKRVKI
ncbi:MAG TPA: dTMP kinase [Candidatus Marinimicrobia bacterium]|nr:dTMP kinase [Candidatus Neomarinimicrobiota bacterium]HRS51172.1 dTMP kinase [Candidatus Neomarinimicrobiota bacterium]HRU91589.1 dTMP kinase [Candidatus Neomarinimicrobiota bacterium]